MDLRPDAPAALRRALPGVRWEDVRVHAGPPPLLRWKRARAMVLPCAWHPRRVHVHLATDDPAALRHEAIHVLQYQQMGPGLGFLRPFVVAYLAWVPWRGTGRSHPMEVPAYADRPEASTPFWRTLAGEGSARWLAPLRLAVGILGGLLALVLGPLVDLRCRDGVEPPP